MPFSPKHILIPVAIDPEDDLILARHAVSAACDIAEKFDSKITLLHLSAPVMGQSSSGAVDISGKVYEALKNILKERLEHGRKKLTDLSKYIEDRGIKVEGRVMESIDNTADAVVQNAQVLKADLLIIGSHGRRGLSRMLFGSVAQKVAERTHVPILLLHPSKEE